MSNHDLKDINTPFYWQAFKEALTHRIDNQSSSKLYIGNEMIRYLHSSYGTSIAEAIMLTHNKYQQSTLLNQPEDKKGHFLLNAAFNQLTSGYKHKMFI